ncbi:hypothetical protein QBC34DRAFT_398423 [Podospora aff. communis PSN243]|uniref:Pentatricopeptide repeat domain-containing protein n=1 Tax=Podospora aff. communis PSN243 TaxID=3040156 RepID=A0AAV9GVK2_9PEZI|nr:hypothetical protein QBC34DRAFT_398423 [Podospora aff. communis PSN243]
MSLGVYQAWRVLRLPVVATRLSAIPRVSLIPTSTRYRHVSMTSTSKPAPNEDSQPRRSKEKSPPLLRYRPRALDLPSQAHIQPLRRPGVPESGFFDRLAELPVRNHNPKDLALPNLSVLVQQPRPYRSRAERNQQLYKYGSAVATQAFLSSALNSRKRGNASIPDWRTTIELLMRTKNAHEVVFETFQLARPAPTYRFGPQGADIVMRIAEENGCDCKPTDIGDPTKGYTLHGPASAAAVAVEQILERDCRVTVTGISSGGPVLVHSGTEYLMVWPRNPVVDPKPITTVEVESLEKWTEQTVDQIVTFITRCRLTEDNLRELQQGDQSRDGAAAKRLLELFRNKKFQAVASPHAFNMALAFLNAKATHEVSAAWEIFRIMRRLGIPRDVDVWNLMLQGAVRMKDLPRVHNYLRQMVTRNLQVTPRTWVLILRLIENEEVRRYILYMMDQRGVLEMPGAVAEVASVMASHDVDRAVALGQNAETFIASQNELYGPRWLGNYSANKIVHAFGCHGRLDDMLTFVKFMFASKIVKDSPITLATTMTHCRLLKSLTFAFRFLRLFESHGKIVDPISLTELFKLLHLRSRPIMLGAVWRYARRNRLMSFEMKRRASELGVNWRRRAAKLFSHVEQGLSEEEHRSLLKTLLPWPAEASPTVGKESGGHQHRQSEAVPETPIVDENSPRVDNSAVDLVHDWLNELDGIVKVKKHSLGKLLVTAERRDNKIARIKLNAAHMLSRRMQKRSKHENRKEGKGRISRSIYLQTRTSGQRRVKVSRPPRGLPRLGREKSGRLRRGMARQLQGASWIREAILRQRQVKQKVDVQVRHHDEENYKRSMRSRRGSQRRSEEPQGADEVSANRRKDVVYTRKRDSTSWPL